MRGDGRSGVGDELIIISNPRARFTEDGWERVGAVDSAGRRSIWMRLDRIDPTSDYDLVTNIRRIELCAGREGSDFYCVIDNTNKSFGDLLDFLCCGRHAVELEGKIE